MKTRTHTPTSKSTVVCRDGTGRTLRIGVRVLSGATRGTFILRGRYFTGVFRGAPSFTVNLYSWLGSTFSTRLSGYSPTAPTGTYGDSTGISSVVSERGSHTHRLVYVRKPDWVNTDSDTGAQSRTPSLNMVKNEDLRLKDFTF